MFTWGVISGAHGVRRRARRASTCVRVLLGIAEAGFFPGIIFFLTLWFPAVYRGADHRLLHGGDSAVHGHRRAGVRAAARDWTASWA